MTQVRATAVLGVCVGVFAGIAHARPQTSELAISTTDERAGAPDTPSVRNFPLSDSIPAPVDPGSTNFVRVLLEPAVLETIGDSERMQVHVLLENDLETTVRTKYALELVDDRGREEHFRSESSVAKVANRAKRSETVVGVPEGLRDGYYILTLTAAAAADEGTTVAMYPLYLHVEDGTITPIDAEEYFTDSNANMAVTR